METTTTSPPSRHDLEARINARRGELIARLVEIKTDTRVETVVVRERLKARLSELARIVKAGVVDGWSSLADTVTHKLDRWLVDSARQLSPRENDVVAMIRPLYDRILARRVAGDGKTRGGLFIPDNAREKPFEALVISVGPGKRLDHGVQPIAVKPGDRILIAKHAGSDIRLLGKDHLMLREDDILAIVEDNAS